VMKINNNVELKQMMIATVYSRNNLEREL